MLRFLKSNRWPALAVAVFVWFVVTGITGRMDYMPRMWIDLSATFALGLLACELVFHGGPRRMRHVQPHVTDYKLAE